jgi:hypothetical protein
MRENSKKNLTSKTQVSFVKEAPDHQHFAQTHKNGVKTKVNTKSGFLGKWMDLKAVLRIAWSNQNFIFYCSS